MSRGDVASVRTWGTHGQTRPKYLTAFEVCSLALRRQYVLQGIQMCSFRRGRANLSRRGPSVIFSLVEMSQGCSVENQEADQDIVDSRTASFSCWCALGKDKGVRGSFRVAKAGYGHDFISWPGKPDSAGTSQNVIDQGLVWLNLGFMEVGLRPTSWGD